MEQLASGVYEGTVRHRRFTPAKNAFTYRVFMMYLDLSELDEVFRGRWLWSVERRNVACWLRRDFHGDPGVPIDEAVRRLVEKRTGRRPDGPIRLLANLRYVGYQFNPVAFYYCFNRAGALETIVAEITNTPWGERHCYVLDERRNTGSADKKRYQLSKEFHVSPFMDMDLDYDWRFTRPDRALSVHMENFDKGKLFFDVTMSLRRREISGATLARVLLQYPLMTAKVVTAIHWQAVRLWLKRVPFFTHPKKRAAAA